MIVNLSGCMPQVKMVYDDTESYLHLFLSVIASSASGKEVMAHVARLAMIFTTLRKFADQWTFHEMRCSNEDFRWAMGMMEVLLQHSLMLSTTFRKEVGSLVEMRHYFWVLEDLETLPFEFCYIDLMNALHSSGISLSTAKRIRIHSLDMQIIGQEEDIYRFKSRKWRVNLKDRSGELSSDERMAPMNLTDLFCR